MRRATLGLATLAFALAASRGAQAQTFYVGNAASDTALGLVPGTEVQIPVRGMGLYGYPYYLQSIRLTFFYDPAALEILGVLPDGLSSIVDSATGSGSFTVSASGCTYGPDAQVLRLRAMLKAGAPDGAYLWIRADTTRFAYFCGSAFLADATSVIAQLCRATDLYGDVDGNARVESRDALIALSAAVGLPVSGFNLGAGDVDGDGLTNSRDALMMLSYAIGLPIYSANRLAQGIPVSCPLLGTVAEKVVFRRQGSTTAADTPYLLDAGVATPILNATGDLAYPRLANDGVSVAYQCTISYAQICRINSDGTGFAQLTSGLENNQAPDWSPDGAKLSFVRYLGYPYYGYFPYTMNADGTSQTQLSSLYSNFGTAAWSRDGTRLAYPSNGVRFVNSDGTNDVPVTTGFTNAQMIRWSPAGDSLAFTRSYGNAIYAVPVAGGTATLIMRFNTLDAINGFDWGPPGFVFGLSEPGRAGIWYLPSPTAPIVRLTRGADFDPAFRRNP